MEVSRIKEVERPILLAEDNQDDIALILRAFERGGVKRRIQALTRGMDAIDYLDGVPPYHNREAFPFPAMVLLDIKMPGMDGFEVLAWIRRRWDAGEVCVVMLTASDHIRDVNEAYRLGANSFLVKPLDFENAAELALALDRVLAECD